MSIQWRHNGSDGVSNQQSPDCLLCRLFGRRWKKTSKLRVSGLCAGNSPVTGEFPAQMASNAENVSIWWRHHVAPIQSDPAITWSISQMWSLYLVRVVPLLFSDAIRRQICGSTLAQAIACSLSKEYLNQCCLISNGILFYFLSLLFVFSIHLRTIYRRHSIDHPKASTIVKFEHHVIPSKLNWACILQQSPTIVKRRSIKIISIV